MKIILAGATGFIGKSLTEKLVSQGYEIVLLTRHPGKVKSQPNLKPVLWNAREGGNWVKEISGADAVINLAGSPIAGKKWTHEVKQDILRSRVQSTHALVHAIQNAEVKPKVLINASAVGYYGHVSKEVVTEKSEPGKGFLPETCQTWEKAALEAQASGVRVVLLRTGVVLEKGGGALAKILPPFYFFMGGPLGSGKQGFPWIHREDEIGAIEHVLTHPQVSGPVNLVAPEAMDFTAFCKAVGRVLGRPCWIRVPGRVLKALMGEMSDVVLKGARVAPQKLLETGYQFQYPTAESALRAIL